MFSEPGELTAKQQQLLREQTITELSPGSLLHNFEALLAFVSENSLTGTGKHHLLPLSSLDALNARMAHPLKLSLTRPVQKSYPHINGLFLLARATGLLIVDRRGGKPRLSLSETALASWRLLNFTEQYFTLLEAYLTHASVQMIGGRERWLDSPGLFNEMIMAWQIIGKRGVKIPAGKSVERMLFTGNFIHYALLELFGLIQVTTGKSANSKEWNIRAMTQTPFGEAMISLVILCRAEQFKQLMEMMQEELDEEEELPPPIEFNTCQKQFQPYFPEWLQSFSLEERSVEQVGVFQFKVSLGKIWRRIAISSQSSLDQLSHAILSSVRFDSDHLHSFEYRNQYGVTEHINHPYMDEPPYTDEVSVGNLPIVPGDEIKYTFDFGDNWCFSLLLESITPPDPNLKIPRLLESHGKAPKQYERW